MKKILEGIKKGNISIEDVINNADIDTNIFFDNLSKYINIKYIDLNSLNIKCDSLMLTYLKQFIKFGIIALRKTPTLILAGMKDPLNLKALDFLNKIYKNNIIEIFISDPRQIDSYLSDMKIDLDISMLIKNIKNDLNSSKMQNRQNNSNIIELIYIILKKAISLRASDIHIEPTDTNCIIRNRIDGVLNQIFQFEISIYPPLSSRIKLLCDMDIAKKKESLKMADFLKIYSKKNMILGFLLCP